MLTLPMSLFALMLLPAGEDAGPHRYARPELLIEAADLARLLGSDKVRVLDCRGKGMFLSGGGHVPGAAWLDAMTWARSFDPSDRDGWARRIGGLGIDVDTTVVIYDDSRAKDAARVWWILRYWGVRDVRLLNGGWLAWRASGRPIEKGDHHPAAVDARLAPQPAHLATKGHVLEHLKGGTQLVDARSNDEFCGVARTAKRNGAIPGAAHLEWSDTVDRTGRFKSPQELVTLFRQAGIDPSRPAITYCQSGGRAAVMAFVLELMGGNDVRNYYRSWAEWGNAEDTPIAKPKK
jgi:thiosulfate/3-mercaptopyruvate sulfurtransferase